MKLPLPPEVIDLVVGAMDSDKDRKLCASVSSAFFRAASQHLYRSMQITVFEDARFSERRCENLNAIFTANPYVLNSIRSLRINFSLEIWGSFSHPDDPMGFENAEEHHEFTKFLLKLTHASGLSELALESLSDEWGDALLVGRPMSEVKDSVLLALIGIRSLRSLSYVDFNRVNNPPAALVFGIPERDNLRNMAVDLGSFVVEAAGTSQTRLLRVPGEAPLAEHFQKANVDWNAILRFHFHPESFRGPLLPKLSHLRLNDPVRYFGYLSGIETQTMGHSGILLPQLQSFHFCTDGRQPWSATPTRAEMAEMGRILESHLVRISDLKVDLQGCSGK